MLKRGRHRIVAGAGLGVTAALGASASAHGATFTVNDSGDPGNGTCDPAPSGCTLRDALAAAAANNNPGTVDRVLFASSVTGTITLNGTELPTIDEPLYIEGPGADTLTVDAANASRILAVHTIYTGGQDVAVSGLTLAGGNALGADGYGGAISSIDSNLTIRSSTLSGNSAGRGGAIAARNLKYEGSIEIDSSTISGNSAGDDGGGLFLAPLGDATSTIRGSTISGNSAQGDGGGIESFGSSEIENSTVSGNSVDGSGGGIHSTAAATIRDSTISDNSAGIDGGGIFSAGINPTVVNTIVANESAGGIGPDLASPNGTFQVAFSLVADPAGAPINPTVAGSNITGVDPQLGVLGDNGGPTKTQALPLSSPAVDAGSSVGSDQRDRPRPVDQPNPDSSAAGANSADIGAFERQDPTPAPDVDTAAPILELSGDKRQHSKSKVKVEVTCDEACSVDAAGTIKVPKSTKRKKFKLLEDSAELGAGETATLKLKFKSKVRKLVTKAFENHQKSTARVSATAADLAGNVSAEEIKVKVKEEQ